MATEREPDAPARRTKAETLRQIGDRLRQVNGDGPCNPPDLVLALDLLIDAHNETLRECETLRAAVAYRPVAAGVSANPLARLKSIATQIIRQIDLLAMPLCADQQEGMSRATRTLVATLIAEMEADGEVPAASARQVERRAVVILADLQRGAAPTPPAAP